MTDWKWQCCLRCWGWRARYEITTSHRLMKFCLLQQQLGMQPARLCYTVKGKVEDTFLKFLEFISHSGQWVKKVNFMP